MSQRAGQSVGIVLGGVAEVYCVHDRKKREVVTEAQIAAIGLAAGVLYDPKQHKLFWCTCCDNLFVGYTDEPKYCHRCTVEPPVHVLGGPLPEPKGVAE